MEPVFLALVLNNGLCCVCTASAHRKLPSQMIGTLSGFDGSFATVWASDKRRRPGWEDFICSCAASAKHMTRRKGGCTTWVLIDFVKATRDESDGNSDFLQHLEWNLNVIDKRRTQWPEKAMGYRSYTKTMKLTGSFERNLD
jgi:hypothetical protein